VSAGVPDKQPPTPGLAGKLGGLVRHGVFVSSGHGKVAPGAGNAKSGHRV